VWKSRPFRSATGVVEVLTEGVNIKAHRILEADNLVKNDITIYGKRTPFSPKDSEVQGRKYPTGGDAWTYNAGTNWTFTLGVDTAEVAAPAPKFGADWLKITEEPVSHDVEFYYDNTALPIHTDGLAGFTVLEFWRVLESTKRLR
jgi:hypothetical protein